MRKEAVIMLLVVLVIAGVGVVYFVDHSRAGGYSTTTATSNGGLQLTVSINAASITPSQRLGIAISLYNTLSTTLNISYVGTMGGGVLIPNGWKVAGFPIAMWGDCIQYQPVEFMLVRGNYDLSELQIASNSSVFPRNWEACYGGQSNVEHFVFQPHSSNATLSGILCTMTCFPPNTFGHYVLASNFTVNGYWGIPLNDSESRDILTPNEPCAIPETCSSQVSYHFPEVGPTAQHLFTTGTYTLIVDDEWGQSLILHFSVS